MKKISLLTLLLSILMATNVYSQVTYKPGYVVTLNNDTLHGKVAHKRDKLLCQVCNFKSNTKENKEYKPGEIKGYGFNDYRYFESTIIDKKAIFVEKLINGALDIYYCQDGTGEQYYYKKEKGTLKSLRYFKKTLYISENTGRVIEESERDIRFEDYSSWNSGRRKVVLKLEDYKLELDSVLSDEPEIKPEINKLKRPSHKGLIKVAQKYHILKHNNENYTVHCKNTHKCEYEITLGRTQINYEDISPDNYYSSYSLKGNFLLSGTNFYLGLGLQYVHVPNDKVTLNSSYSSLYLLDEQEYSFFKLPVSIGYRFSGQIIRPYMSVGINVVGVQKKQDDEGLNFDGDPFLPACNVGLAIKVYKGIQLVYNFQGELDDINVFDSNEFSHGHAIGIRIEPW